MYIEKEDWFRIQDFFKQNWVTEDASPGGYSEYCRYCESPVWHPEHKEGRAEHLSNCLYVLVMKYN